MAFTQNYEMNYSVGCLLNVKYTPFKADMVVDRYGGWHT